MAADTISGYIQGLLDGIEFKQTAYALPFRFSLRPHDAYLYLDMIGLRRGLYRSAVAFTIPPRLGEDESIRDILLDGWRLPLGKDIVSRRSRRARQSLAAGQT
jgi:hypothetical protein